MDQSEPQWQPISNLPFLTAHISQGVALAREHLDLLAQAHGAYKLSNADVAAVTKSWTQTRTDLIELYTAQGRRWQALNLSTTRRQAVDRYLALVDDALVLTDQILALAHELKAWTIEALLSKTDEQLGREALLGEHT